MKMLAKAGLLLIAGILFGCSSENRQLNVSTKTSFPASVVTRHFQSGPVLLKLDGQIEPDFGKEVDVSSRVFGRVVHINVRPGDSVKPGQVLATLDSHELSSIQAELIEAKGKLAIAAAQKERENQIYQEQLMRPKSLIEAKAKFAETKSQLELAESEFQRQQSLFTEKIASQRSYTAAKIAGEEAKNNFETAKLNMQREEHLYSNQALLKKDLQLADAAYQQALSHLDTLKQRLLFYGMSKEDIDATLNKNHIGGTLQIVAPVAGIVAHTDIAEGEMVHNTDTMFKIVDLDTVIVKADLPEKDLALVKLGSTVQVVVPSYPQQVFEGTINFISEAVHRQTRMVTIRAKLNNEKHLLKANMSAQIVLQGEGKTFSRASSTPN